MLVVRIPMLVISHKVFQIFGEEESVVINFAKPFGSIQMMLRHVNPRPPHFLPNVSAYLFLFRLGIDASVPRPRHVHKDDILWKCPRWEFRIMPVPFESLHATADSNGCFLLRDFIPTQRTTDDGIREEVDDVASFAPRGHDDVVEFGIPDERNHAVNSVVGVFIFVAAASASCDGLRTLQVDIAFRRSAAGGGSPFAPKIGFRGCRPRCRGCLRQSGLRRRVQRSG